MVVGYRELNDSETWQDRCACCVQNKRHFFGCAGALLLIILVAIPIGLDIQKRRQRASKQHPQHFVTKTIYYIRHAESMSNAVGIGTINNTLWLTAKDSPLSPHGFEELLLLKNNITLHKNSQWLDLTTTLRNSTKNTSNSVAFLSSDLRRALLTVWTVIDTYRAIIPNMFMNKLLISPYLRELQDSKFPPSQSVLLSDSTVIPEINQSLKVTYEYAVKANQSTTLPNEIQAVMNKFAKFTNFKVLKNQRKKFRRGIARDRLKKFVNFMKELSEETLVIGGHSAWIVKFFKIDFVTMNATTCSFDFKEPKGIINTETLKFDVRINTKNNAVMVSNCEKIYVPSQEACQGKCNVLN